MKKLSRHDRAQMVLRRIEQYPTLSAYCRILYRAIFEWLETQEVESEKLDQAFQLLLRCECRRHDQVGRIVRSGNLDFLEVVRVGRHARKNLSRLVRSVEQLRAHTAREAVIRELIVAECYSHLGSTRKVVGALSRAIGLGCEHALAHFALGYNLYQDALRNFAGEASGSRKAIISRPAEFADACRVSLRAFERGLGLDDGRFDARIWWWIGMVNETIGERRAAREAFAKAMAMNPRKFAGAGQAKIRRLSTCKPGLRRTPAEKAWLDRLGPITKEEMDRARAFLTSLEDFPFEFAQNDEE